MENKKSLIDNSPYGKSKSLLVILLYSDSLRHPIQPYPLPVYSTCLEFSKMSSTFAANYS